MNAITTHRNAGPAKVSVIVPVTEPSPELFSLLGSLDRQSLPYEAFEVDVVVADDVPARSRLEVHAGRRPNLKVIVADAGSSAAALCAAAVPVAVGDWVLIVRPEDRLLPQSLEHLLDRDQDADLIVARTVGLFGAYTDPILFGAPASSDDLGAAVMREPAVLIRRELAETAPEALAPGDRAPLLAGAPKIAILIGYPGLDIRRRTAWHPPTAPELPEGLSGVAERWRRLDRPSGAVSVQWDPPTVGWSDGSLLVECTGRVTGLSGPDAAAVLRVREPADGVDLVLPAEIHWLSAAGEPGAVREVRIRARLDPSTGWDGRPLGSAIYQLYADVVGMGFRAQAPLRGCTPCGAIIAGQPVGVVTIEDRLHLDVGCGRCSLVQQADAGDAVITDSARGTLLHLALPRIMAETGTDLSGQIGLGGLKVPARIVEENGTARLEAYVSGLAGQPRLSTRFGTAWTPLDLVLDISPTGRMQLRPRPVVRPAPVPKAAAIPATKPAAVAASALRP